MTPVAVDSPGDRASGVVERDHEHTEHVRQPPLLRLRQTVQQVALTHQQPVQRSIHGQPPRGGELHLHPAPVARVGQPGNQAASGHPVDPVGHRAACDEGLGDQLAGGQLVGRPGPPQRRQARKDMARVERRIEKLTEREQQLHADMAADAGDYARLAELQTELTEVTAEKHRLEDEWLQAAEWLTDAG